MGKRLVGARTDSLPVKRSLKLDEREERADALRGHS